MLRRLVCRNCGVSQVKWNRLSFGGEQKKNPKIAKWGNYARRTAIAVLTKKKKNAEFTLKQCKMLVDIGLAPLQFYLYGSDDRDEVGKHQNSTKRNTSQTLTETASTVTQSLAVITMNMTQFVASTSRKMAKDNNQNIEEDQGILDDDDMKPADVVFATAGNVTHPIVATTGNKTQSLAVSPSHLQRQPATSSDLAQSTVAASDSDVAQSLATMAINISQSTVFAIDNDVAQSLAAMVSNVVQSTVAATDNTETELAYFHPR
jgi:hypothetical protein